MDKKTLRPIDMEIGFLRNRPGSVLVSFGGTRVLCTASLEATVPPFRKGTGLGWLTCEYAMLPASTTPRRRREMMKRDGRSVEIQRLIGRSLRAAVDFAALGERTITIDCDVLEADGGTRTASITGGFVALAAEAYGWVREGKLPYSPILRPVAAVSVGIVADAPVLDLDYANDSRAQVDMNVVMAGGGDLIEVQGTGEERPFSRGELATMLSLAEGGIGELFAMQRQALGPRAFAVRSWQEPLVVATQNEGKLREMRVLLSRAYGNVISLGEAGFDEQAEEDGDTFSANAILKAEHAMRLTGKAALADDSGLAVDLLGGEPGVYSARYAGTEGTREERDAANLRLVLDKLRGREGCSTARFLCAVALARPGKETVVATGAVEGRIIDAPRGGNGFGYDPIFVPEGEELTFAELSAEVKNGMSHRARAIENLLRMLGQEDEVAYES
jgi:XTP/dITP diphosphohydrolase